MEMPVSQTFLVVSYTKIFDNLSSQQESIPAGSKVSITKRSI